MGVVTDGLTMVSQFMLGRGIIPRSFEAPLIVLGIYLIYLVLAGLILYYSVKISGGDMDFYTGFPRALFTIFLRDLIAVPLIFLTFFFPFIGIIIAIAVWLTLIKIIFHLTWGKAVLAWLISLILPLVIALFVLIPLAIILLV